jgi:hypothetical protein
MTGVRFTAASPLRSDRRWNQTCVRSGGHWDPSWSGRESDHTFQSNVDYKMELCSKCFTILHCVAFRNSGILIVITGFDPEDGRNILLRKSADSFKAHGAVRSWDNSAAPAKDYGLHCWISISDTGKGIFCSLQLRTPPFSLYKIGAWPVFFRE